MSPLLPSNVSHCSLMNCTKFLSFLFIIFKHRRICNKNKWATRPVQWTPLKILVVPKIVDSQQFQNFSRYHWERSITNITAILTKSMNMRHYREPLVTAILRLWRPASDPDDDMRRSASDRLPCATESCTAPCTTLPGVQERSHRAERISVHWMVMKRTLRILFCTDNGQIQHSF